MGYFRNVYFIHFHVGMHATVIRSVPFTGACYNLEKPTADYKKNDLRVECYVSYVIITLYYFCMYI